MNYLNKTCTIGSNKKEYTIIKVNDYSFDLKHIKSGAVLLNIQKQLVTVEAVDND